MIDQIIGLPEYGLKSSPETSHFRENTSISQKIKVSCTFLHLTKLFIWEPVKNLQLLLKYVHEEIAPLFRRTYLIKNQWISC